ncbi:response regulator [Photobacterium sp. 1_MG-2023]|uniref:response regulator n=1 Tax=Photobacterium sp. 1_MG-2023 TaxID=3062646 RepID=UPI0026E18CE7|nr:response regulator [Photobacterium sp. 1_MG-2023]MDO6704581.1 response regulator [Photobacterium sp. 1_MG-2023]
MPDKVQSINLTSPPWPKLRVLVIDDQHSAQSFMKSMLLRFGIRHIDTASNYREAISQCQQAAYQLILVDYHLDHTLNGSELISLLRKKQLLSADCGLVIFSADASARVVLSALAVEPDAFMTLPMPLRSLQEKLTQAWRNSQARQPVYHQVSEKGFDEGIRYCKEQLLKHGPDYQLESLLLDMLLDKEDWAQAKRYIALFQTYHPSAKVALAEARLLAHTTDKHSAIQLLRRLVEKSPMCLDALDLLASYQSDTGQYHEAMLTANRALKLNPAASHRALKLAQLAAKTGQGEPLIQAGMTLATHLPIIDVGWIICLAEYCAAFEQHYFSQPEAKVRRQLRHKLHQITERAHHRVLPAQRPFLNAFRQIMDARLLLAQGATLKAKRRLMLGLSGYFGCLNKLPSVILAEALPLLLQLGETGLIADICQVLKHRDRFDGHSQLRMQALRENHCAFEALRKLESALRAAQSACQSQPAQALLQFEAILRDYPDCTEANLGKIDCLLRIPQSAFQCDFTRQLAAVSTMPLPPLLSQWRTLLRGQISHLPESQFRSGQYRSLRRELGPVRIQTWAPLLH